MAPEYTAGDHYEEISPPQSVMVPRGTVEVLGFFCYNDANCAKFEASASTEGWYGEQSAVVFRRVPFTLSSGSDPLGRMYLALADLGRLDLHAKVYQAVLEEKRMFLTPESQAEWATSMGIDKQKYLAAYSSFNNKGSSFRPPTRGISTTSTMCRPRSCRAGTRQARPTPRPRTQPSRSSTT